MNDCGMCNIYIYIKYLVGVCLRSFSWVFFAMSIVFVYYWEGCACMELAGMCKVA